MEEIAETEKSNFNFELAERFINHTKRHVFLTGKAGTGKTTFLKRITQTTHKKTIVAATTGIAAINANGVTLHSQFQLPLAAFIPARIEFQTNLSTNFETQSTILRHMRMSNEKRNIIREAELLIIDEVSMLRADTLDAIDFILRYVRKNQYSFGGIQVLFIGDMLQLPPIVKDTEWEVLSKYYNSIYFFNAKALEKDKPIYIELDKIYRQSDTKFTDILNKVRYNTLNAEDVEFLNTYYKVQPTNIKDEYITLTTHNVKADAINKEELSKIKNKSYFYNAEIADDFPEHISPTEKRLELKVGAQVMFIKNDTSSEKKYYNGKIGIVTDLDEYTISVLIDGKTTIVVEEYTWENIKYTIDEESREIKEEVLGSFKQFPLKLAWAITVHKSQGLTFERAILDVKNVFASGQMYVALSRLKSLDGLVLSSPIQMKGIKHDETIIDYEKNKIEQSVADDILHFESWQYILDYNKNAFDFRNLEKLWMEHIDSFKTEESNSNKLLFKEWSIKQLVQLQKISNISDSFKTQLNNLYQSKDLHKLHQRIFDANKYFEKELREFCISINTHKSEIADLKRIKTYLKELDELEVSLFQKIAEINKSFHIIDAFLFKKELVKKNIRESLDIEWRKQSKEQAGIKEKKKKSKKGSSEEKEKAIKVNTYSETLELYKKGHSIEEIVELRNLKLSTIYSHITELIKLGKMDVEEVMDALKIEPIKEALHKFPEKSLTEIRVILKEEFSFEELRWVKSSITSASII
jgi:PIF1-like helicase/Helix-turn-helix domain